MHCLTRLLPVLAVTMVLTSGSFAAEGGDAITDAKAAGPDFAVQGEYIGNFDLGDGVEQKFGLQVVALSENKYRGVAYFGGLPGAGWDGFGKLETEGEAGDDGTLKLVAAEGFALIKDGEAKIFTADDQEIGLLKRIDRKSETLGAEPPEGAIVLFDGSNADAWKSGSMTEDGLLRGGCVTKQAFADFTLHMEFRTPYMPAARGQGRGNSGVYLQNRYEVQILDSFGLEGLDNECGGFYTLKAPRENMCLPPLSWQSYDIDFVGAKYEGDKKVAPPRATVRHNGVLIHEDFAIMKDTPGGIGEGPESAGIFLQDHGNPVVFRNIWAVEH